MSRVEIAFDGCECVAEVEIEVLAPGILRAQPAHYVRHCPKHLRGRFYHPGEVPARSAGGSAEAASQVARSVRLLERDCLEMLAAHPEGLGPVQLAKLKGWRFDRARPRMTTMAKRELPLVRDTGRKVEIEGTQFHEAIYEITAAGLSALAMGEVA